MRLAATHETWMALMAITMYRLDIESATAAWTRLSSTVYALGLWS